MCYWSLDLKFKAKLKLESENRKIQYGRQAAILKVTLLKINRPLSIYTSDVALKFGLDIESQTKVRVRKPKNPRWPPGGHFESDIAENRHASAHGHKQYAYKIWNWNSKANLSYAPETMSPTDRRTDRQIDEGQGESSITPPPPPPPPQQQQPQPQPPPSTLLGGGINTKHCRLKWRGSQSTYVADNIFFKVNEKYEIG